MFFTDSVTSRLRAGLRRGVVAIVLGQAWVCHAQLQGTDTQAFIASKPAQLQPAYHKLNSEGERNSVLNNMIITTRAVKIGDYREAADAIDRALFDIKKYYGHSKAAAQARSLWYEEGSKAFKGEPYERAMANYYRGMLDLRAGDFDNARAAFDNGFLQDAFAEEQQHRSDFALLAFLAGWAATMSGSDSLAEERYAELLTLRPDFKIPDAGDNTLVVIETGKSPRKLADGVGHSELVYRRGKKFKEKGVSVNLGGMRTAYVMEDIYMQAATRGGRLVDRINEGKVQFRKKQTRSGSLLTESASAIQSAEAYGDIGGLGDIAAGVSLLGTLQLFAAQNAKPRADTRYWDGLPEAVHILTFNSQTFTESEIDIQYLDKTGAPLPSMQAREPIHKTPDGVGLVWAFSQK